MKIFVGQINPTIGDLAGNTKKIISQIDKARLEKADVVLFSELVICGYLPEDLLFFDSFIQEMEKKYLNKIIEESNGLMVVVGLARKNPKEKEKGLLNSAAIIIDGKLIGFKDKTLLPTYDVFDERRYFDPGEKQAVWKYKNKNIGILICEDFWQHEGCVHYTRYLRDPVDELKKLHPDLILGLSASPYYFKKIETRISVFSTTAKSSNCPVIICNQVGGNDQLVFDGHSMVIDKSGHVCKLLDGFVQSSMLIDSENLPREVDLKIDHLSDLYRALVLGIKDYFVKQNLHSACFGLSGGIDSALVGCIASDALGPENVLAVFMPSRYSSKQSKKDAYQLAKNLRLNIKEIDIDQNFKQMLDLLNPHFEKKKEDVTEENLQARIRGMILMALSNKHKYIVLSTGNKSEVATGYCTLYGDMVGGLGVLIDVPKTLVYDLSKWINKDTEIIPKSIIEKPPSAELKENQKDTDTLPEYEIVDKVLNDYLEKYHTVEQISKDHKLKKELVKDLIERIHLAEYKRRQSPPGIRVTKKSFSKGRLFPIVQKWI
jgi:NAD+ synthase (glutamine-hydrolysing)